METSKKKRYALQCWTCNSEFDVTCRDYFNKTRIQENRQHIDNIVYENRNIQPVRNEPHLRICEDRHTIATGYKNVCIKKVTKDFNGIPNVRRECRLVPETSKVGECPDDTKSQDLQFCATCDTDGCNGANSVKTDAFLAAAVSISLVLILRK
ncbi:hypothetical protein NQ318_022424 [Aromia moschata]|uniref:Protein sleepless n=1 Tax=Aromia moschata TaxID=1265417 RepID=A0AAV8Z5N0_9CUCU|nr:hypothetical protein NQ318_022424 [Aromia moschata]